MQNPFLTAEWRKLAMANYVVDPELLKPYLPAHTELDLWEGKCYVSLVGFMFLNTKLKGIPIPFHTNFEEVNLRFYVTYKDNGELKRGVVFIKEIVPKAALSFVANTIYKEHYETLAMKHLWDTKGDKQLVAYQWKKGDWNTFSLVADKQALALTPGSEAAFITEHYWGYTRLNDSTTSEYKVEHPPWDVYPVSDYNIEVDFAKVYGEDFAVLNTMQPTSVLLAEGSVIAVGAARKIS